MSMVDSNQSLNNILDKLGIQPQEQQKRANGGALGQEDFKIDDYPITESGPFCTDGKCRLTQMAQFSTVTGITDMDKLLKASQISCLNSELQPPLTC